MLSLTFSAHNPFMKAHYECKSGWGKGSNQIAAPRFSLCAVFGFVFAFVAVVVAMIVVGVVICYSKIRLDCVSTERWTQLENFNLALHIRRVTQRQQQLPATGIRLKLIQLNFQAKQTPTDDKFES